MESPQHEVVIVGAGVSGIYQLYRLKQLGVNATVLEVARDVGGTWYRNRYPGCRFDSESYTYGYCLSKELLQEWDWPERFSAQPDALRYLNHIAKMYSTMLMRKAKGWFTGYNSNVDGHEHGKVRHLVYNGGAPISSRPSTRVAEDNNEGMNFE